MDNFYEEPRQLNMKKVIIISAILVILLIVIITSIIKHFTKPAETNSTITETSTIFYSTDNSFSVELSNNYNLADFNSNLGYLLELRSEDNLNVFISKKEAFQGKSLSEIIDADKSAYLEKFENYSNLSEIKELSVNNNIAYTYSFHYLDKNLNQAFYLQVVWLQIDNNYYVFDIEFPLDDLSFNSNIATAVLSTFQEI